MIFAAVSHADGTPFTGSVEFTASRGEIPVRRVACDNKGNASTLLSASPGLITVTARAGGAVESLEVNLVAPTSSTGDYPEPPPKPNLVFRASPANTQVNSPLRPAPVVAVENGPTGFGAEGPITLNVTSCSAQLDPTSELTVSTIGRIAVFENLRFTTPATGCQLVANSPGFHFRESARFDVLP